MPIIADDQPTEQRPVVAGQLVGATLDRLPNAVRGTVEWATGTHVAGPLEPELADHVLPRDPTLALVVEAAPLAVHHHELATTPAIDTYPQRPPASPHLEPFAVDLEQDPRRCPERLRVIDQSRPTLERPELPRGETGRLGIAAQPGEHADQQQQHQHPTRHRIAPADRHPGHHRNQGAEPPVGPPAAHGCDRRSRNDSVI